MMYHQDFAPGVPPRRILVTEIQHAIVIRDGVVEGTLPPGRHRLRRRRDRVWYESALSQVQIVPSQEVITNDGATVRVTVAAVVTVTDPLAAMQAGSWRQRLHLDVQTALRSLVTQSSLEELIADRASIDDRLEAAIEPAATAMGLEVEQIGVRDLVVAGDLRKRMADVLAAKMAAQAGVERARGETAALRSLANAASLVKDNPELYRLRLLQEIATSSDNTFVIDAAAGAKAERHGGRRSRRSDD